MSRQEFPRAVKAEALKRCMDASGTPRCEGCGVALKAGQYAFDHKRADGLLGKPTLDNCQVLCTGFGSCHDVKTRVDTSTIAQAKRREAKHFLIDGPTSAEIQSAGFARNRSKHEKRERRRQDREALAALASKVNPKLARMEGRGQ